MKTWKTITVTLTVLAIIGAAVIAAASAMPWAFGTTNTNNYGYGGMMSGRGGMMGGYGYNYGNPTQTAPSTQYYQPVFPFMFGGGCLGRLGLGGYSYTTTPYTQTGTQLNITTAKTIAQNYVTALNNPDLTVKQIEEYQANYYIQVTEKSTGNGAFELLINKYTGSIYPEMGPNMMWNTKYGMMRSGILGGIYGNPTATMPVTAAQATTNAQQYLTSYIPGTTTGDVTTFYGYYTIEVLNGTTSYGMLSVNGHTGAVWFHTWHGTFLQELEVS